jgi:hypothetical protein
MEEGNPFLLYFIAGVVGLIIWIAYRNQFQELLSVQSTTDQREYLVQPGPDQQSAADLLADVRVNLERMRDHLVQEFSDDERSQRLAELFQPDSIVEASADSKTTSYTINKGEKMVLCLRSRDGSNQLEDLNTLTFVALHEMSHILTKSVGHTDEFWNNFEWVLKEAVKAGIWQYQDFSRDPVSYCGVEITSSPLGATDAEKALLEQTFRH